MVQHADHGQNRRRKGPFTDRELGILRHVAAGATNEEAAACLNLSAHTVAGHLRAMLRRSKARNRAELVARAYAAGVLVPGKWPPGLSGRRPMRMSPEDLRMPPQDGENYRQKAPQHGM